MTTTAAQRRKIEDLRAKVTKTYGEKAITTMDKMPPMLVYPGCSLALDYSLGAGGIPRNRVMEFSGPESSGKTTLALLHMKKFLELDPTRDGLFLDVEHKLSESWVRTLVGDELMDRIILAFPDDAEEATNIYRDVVRSDLVQMVIYDSIGGAPTSASMEKDAEIGSFGGNAKAITNFARIAANFSAKYNCLTLGINQERQDLKSRHGNMLNTPGGNGWKHACVARINVRRNGEKFEDKINGEILQVGFGVRAKVIKNQMGGPENRVAEWNFYSMPSQYGPVGIDTTEECIRLSELVGVVTQGGGGYFSHPDLPGGKVRGRIALRDYILANTSFRDVLVKQVVHALDTDKTLIARIAPIEVDSEDSELPVWSSPPTSEKLPGAKLGL